MASFITIGINKLKEEDELSKRIKENKGKRGNGRFVCGNEIDGTQCRSIEFSEPFSKKVKGNGNGDKERYVSCLKCGKEFLYRDVNPDKIIDSRNDFTVVTL